MSTTPPTLPPLPEFRYFTDKNGDRWKVGTDDESGFFAMDGKWIHVGVRLRHLLAPKGKANDGTVETDEAGTPLASTAPTHRCKICGALWIEYPGSWSLHSPECGKCCDNVTMGDQIEKLVPAPARGGVVKRNPLASLPPCDHDECGPLECKHPAPPPGATPVDAPLTTGFRQVWTHEGAAKRIAELERELAASAAVAEGLHNALAVLLPIAVEAVNKLNEMGELEYPSGNYAEITQAHLIVERWKAAALATGQQPPRPTPTTLPSGAG